MKSKVNVILEGLHTDNNVSEASSKEYKISKKLFNDTKSMYEKLKKNLLGVKFENATDLADGIKKAFELAGGKGYVSVESTTYVKYRGEVKGYTIGGSVSLKSMTKGDLNTLAEDLTVGYYKAHGGQSHYTPDLIKFLNGEKPTNGSVFVVEGCIDEEKNACTKGGNAFSKISFALRKYTQDIDCELKSLETGRVGEITEIDIRINRENPKGVKLADDFGFKPANVGVTSQDKGKENQDGYRLNDKSAITAFLKFLNKQTGELKGCIVYKDSVEEAYILESDSAEYNEFKRKCAGNATYKKAEAICKKYGYSLAPLCYVETYAGKKEVMFNVIEDRDSYSPEIYYGSSFGKEPAFSIQTTAYGSMNIKEHDKFVEAVVSANKMVKELSKLDLTTLYEYKRD